MDDQTLLRILGDVERLKQETVRLRRGEITDDAVPEIDLGGSGTSVAATTLSGYTPVDGEQVAALVRGRDAPVILGVTESAAGGGGGTDPYINVTESPYNASGDGSTDDTAAINGAIAAVSAMASATNQLRLVFPPGIYLTDGILVQPNVWLDFGSAYIKKRSDGASVNTNSLVRAVPVSGYGSYENITITGGHFDPNGFECPAHIINLIYCENLSLTGMTVYHDPANQTWAYCVGGRKMRISDCNVRDGTLQFQDGIHIYHGQDIVVTGGVIDSGDDCISLGGESTDTVLAADPDPIRQVTVSGTVCNSARVSCVKIYVSSGATDSTDWEVSDVVIQGITGGAKGSAPIAIRDINDRAVGTGRIKRVKVKNFSLYMGDSPTVASSSFPGTPYGVYIQSANHVEIDGQIEFFADNTAASGWRLAYISKTLRPRITLECSALPEGGGIEFSNTSRGKIQNCDVVGNSADGNAPMIQLTSAPNTELIHNNMTEQKSGQNIVEVSAGTTTSLRIYGGRYAHTSGASAGTGIISYAAAGLTAVEIKDVDLSGAFAKLSANIASVAYRDVAQNRGATPPATVTGSRGGNAALADLLTELAALGLITDSSSA
jgi:hypothetical protein